MCLSDEGLVGREVEEGTEVGFGETETGEVGVAEGENLRGGGCVRVAWVDDGREKRERAEQSGVWSVDSIFIFTSRVRVNECNVSFSPKQVVKITET